MSEYLESAAARGGLNETEIAALGTLYALNEALFPTSLLDVAGPLGKAVGKAGRLIKAGAKAEDAAGVALQEVKGAGYVPNIGAIGNMKDYLKSPGFGGDLGLTSTKTGGIIDGQAVYKSSDDVGTYIRSGDQFYLDGSHKNHLEVFDRSGNFRYVLNLDGSVNVKKTASAQGRKLR